GASLNQETTSSVASMRLRNSLRSISSVCLRNAALPPPRKAISLVKTNNGRSSLRSWSSPRRFGDETQQTAVPCRSRWQPAAPCRVEGGAGEARQGGNQRRRSRCHRRSRDRAGDQETGGGRA